MFLTRRQREVYEYVKDHIERQGYAPSISEIGERFDLSSPATVHKHLERLEEKGMIRREQNRSRAIELVETDDLAPVELPLLGMIAAGKPIDAVPDAERIALLPDMKGREVFVLRVNGQSMIEDHIQDGDYVIVERRNHAENGETVVALIDGHNATLKRFYREADHIRLQPANETMQPIIIKEEAFEIQGVVISVLRKFRE